MYDGYSAYEFQIIKTMQRMIHDATHGKTNCLKWIFEERYIIRGITMSKCCQLIGLHHDLVRIRMQYELSKQHIHSVAKLNSKLPLVLRDEIGYELGSPAIILAEQIWQNPGIMIDDMNLVDLLGKRFVANIDNHFYLTGRVPVTNQCLHWSKCWSFYG